MSKTHLRFKNFRPQVIEAASRLFEAKPWQESFGSEEQMEVAKRFVSEVSAAYNVANAEIEVSRWQYSPASYQSAQVMVNGLDQIQSIAPAKIILSRWSITSLFIAVRTHLLANGVEQKTDDPEAWAHSLFYTVKPAMFRARVREGRIGGLVARDTFTRETWAKLVEAGVGQEWNGSIVCRPNEVNGIIAQIEAGTFTGYGTVVDPDFVAEDADESDLVDTDNLDDELEFDADQEDPWDDDVIAQEAASDLEAETNAGTTVEQVSETSATAASNAEQAAEVAEDAVQALKSMGIVKLRKASRGRLQGGYTLPLDRLAAMLAAQGVTPADVEAAVAAR